MFIDIQTPDGRLVFEAPEGADMGIADRGYLIKDGVVTHQITLGNIEDTIGILRQSESSEGDRQYGEFLAGEWEAGRIGEIEHEDVKIRIIPLQRPVDLRAMLEANDALYDVNFGKHSTPEDILDAYDKFEAAGFNHNEHSMVEEGMRDSELYKALRAQLEQRPPDWRGRLDGEGTDRGGRGV